MAQEDTETGDPPALALHPDEARDEVTAAEENGEPVARPVRDRSRAHEAAAMTRTVAELEDRFATMEDRLEEARDAIEELRDAMP